MSIHKGVGEEGEKGGREEGGNRKGKRRERTLLTKKKMHLQMETTQLTGSISYPSPIHHFITSSFRLLPSVSLLAV